MSTNDRFSIAAEIANDGSFKRQVNVFRDEVGPAGESEFPAEAGRYHLYICWACPWAHRAAIARHLKGLEDMISMSAVDPVRDARGWAFTGGQLVKAAVSGTDCRNEPELQHLLEIGAKSWRNGCDQRERRLKSVSSNR